MENKKKIKKAKIEFLFLNEILNTLNIEMQEKQNNDLILKLKEINKIHIKRISKKFCIGIFVYFMILIFTLGFNFSSIDLNDWPLIHLDTDFKKYYNTQNNKEAVQFFNDKIIGKYPDCIDYVIWYMFTGITLSLTINKSGFSLFGVATNYIFAISETISLIKFFLNLDWQGLYEPSWVGFLMFSTRTYSSHFVHGILMNLFQRWFYFLAYLVSHHVEGSKVWFLTKISLISLFIVFPLSLLTLVGGLFLLLSILVLSPYFICGLIFALTPFLLILLISVNVSGLIILPVQLAIVNLLSFKIFKSNNKKSNQEELSINSIIDKNKEQLVENPNNEIENSDTKTLVTHNIENGQDFFNDEKLNDQESEYIPFLPNKFRLLMREILLLIRFFLILFNIALQFSIFMFNGLNVLSSSYIFMGLPYFSVNFYSFKFQKYFDNLYNLLARISTLI